MSSAQWSDEDHEGGDAVGSDTAVAAGGISASMFSAAPRKIGIRPSNRRIGTNFSGWSGELPQTSDDLFVETENVFVADVQTKSVRLASIRPRHRTPGQHQMVPASMEDEDIA